MGDSLKFADPNWLYLLLLIVPLIAVKVVAGNTSREGLEQLTSSRLREHLIPERRPLGDWGRFALQLIGFALLAVALARPQKGYIEEMTRVEGRNIIIAIDTSRSMLAEDISPNSRISRLTQAKLAAIDLIEALPDDRIGLIAFAGTAFMQAPLTPDHNAVVETITQLNTYVIQRGGTKLSSAIDLARERLVQTAAASNALIIFTDGEDHEGIALKAAEKADQDNIHIITIGVGSENPTIVPDPESRQANTFLKNSKGELVKSSMDRESLEKIAKATNGTFVALNRLQGGLNDAELVKQVLANISYSESEEKLKRTPRERYALPLAIGLGCIAAGFIATLWGSRPAPRQAIAALLLLGLFTPIRAESAPLQDAYAAYEEGDYSKAKEHYESAAKSIKNPSAQHELRFGQGASAYKNGDYDDAVEAFSTALLSDTPELQERSHYNLGNTLFRRGEAMWKDEDGGMAKLDDVIREWEDSADHYRSSLEIKADNQDAKANLEIVENLIEKLNELKEPEQEDQEPEEEEKKDEEEEDKPEEEEEEEDPEEKKDEEEEEPGDEQDEEKESPDEPSEPSEENEEAEGDPGEEGEETEPEEGSESDEPAEESDTEEPGEGTDPGEDGQTSEEDGEGQTGGESDRDPQDGSDEIQTVDPDDEVDEETGYSKNQARENLRELSDEQGGLGLLQRRRFRGQSQRYRDW